jgi:adenine-specific DNA-methyltransferase
VNYDDLSQEALIEILKRRDAQARYGLHWEREALDPERALNRDFVGFELNPERSVGDGQWQNLLIEGDNYDALRMLATTHAGEFHLLYADVPYNTGNKDFVYNDRFVDKTHRFRHSLWLEFIYQRMVLAKQLLREDGSIFVSIDDNEQANLRLLMNQVFGEKCFVASCIWQKRYSRENREAIGDAHEYILVYSPNPAKFKKRRGRIPLTVKQAKVYKNPANPKDVDPTRRWRSIPMTAQGFRENQMYRITAPNGTPHDPPEGRCWGMLETEFEKLKSKGRIYWGKDGNAQPGVIRYLNEVKGAVPWTWWPHSEVGHTDEARKEIQDIFGTQTAFDTPKPVRLMERILAIGAPEKDALVLDFFAGSGTTGHALLKMNALDGGTRRFVLISNKERTLEKPEKNLCRDVCAVRLRRAIEGYTGSKGAQAPTGGTFAYLATATVPMHRLEEGLTDEMVWSYAQMAFNHPLTLHSGPLNVSICGSHLLVYCCDTKSATMMRLREVVGAHFGQVVVLSWVPSAIEEALGTQIDKASVVAVPGDLKRAFKQGNARVLEDGAALPVAAPDTELATDDAPAEADEEEPFEFEEEVDE